MTKLVVPSQTGPSQSVPIVDCVVNTAAWFGSLRLSSFSVDAAIGHAVIPHAAMSEMFQASRVP